METWRAKVAIPTVGLVCLCGLAFSLRLWFFLETPHPLGADGYYYATQIEQLFLSGHLHTPEGSWVVYFLGGFHALWTDPVIALKVGQATLAALCVPGAYLAGTALAKTVPDDPSNRAGWILAIWAAASPSLSGLSAEFPKNLGIVPALLLVVFFALRGTRDKNLGDYLIAVVVALLAMTAHRTGVLLLALGIVGAMVGWFFSPARRRWSTRMGVMATGAVGALFVTFVLASTFVPNLLHVSDLEGISQQFDWSIGVPPPFSYFALRDFHWAQRVELALAWIGVPMGAWMWWRRPKQRPHVGAAMLPLLVLLFPFWRRDQLDLGFRLSLLAPMFAMAVLSMVRPRFPWPRPLDSKVQSRAHSTIRRWLMIAVALMHVVMLAPTGIDNRVMPPYDRYRAVLESIPEPGPQRLIAHRGINFYYGYLTENIGVAWALSPDLDATDIFRLAWGIRDGEWVELLPTVDGRPRPVRLDPSYVYVREDVWRDFVSNARATGDEELIERIDSWQNPGRP